MSEYAPPGSRRAVRLVAGLVSGAGTALVELGYLSACWLAVGLVAPWPRLRRSLVTAVESGAAALAAVELRRLHRWGGPPAPAVLEQTRASRYLAARCVIGLLGGAVLALFGYGVVSAALWVSAGFSFGAGDTSGPLVKIAFGVVGLVLLFLCLYGAMGVVSLDRSVARSFLAPRDRRRLEQRIAELAMSRAEVVTAVDNERRRIERDLHDGVQQRLVALGMLIGRARRSPSPERAEILLSQAQAESQLALVELREVAWRAYPIALDDAGLRETLETVAERCSLPVDLRCELAAEPVGATATAAYFIVSETLTNAAKHSAATLVTVRVVALHGRLTIRVRDDGVGGADPAGGGLGGLARRTAALDGRFTVDSPAGGPTTITVELPCG